MVRDRFMGEPGDRLEIAADIVWPPRRAVVRLEVKHHGKRSYDHGLALLGAAQLLLRAQAVGVRAKGRVEKRLLQASLSLDLLGLLEQVDEHRDLGAQNDRVNWLEHIVDSAHRVSTKLVLGLLVHCGQEDNRYALGLVAAADDLSGLITVHPGHVDVEQDDRELAFQEMAKRFLARAGRDHLSKVLEDAGYCEQVPLIVVDQQHARFIRPVAGTIVLA